MLVINIRSSPVSVSCFYLYLKYNKPGRDTTRINIQICSGKTRTENKPETKKKQFNRENPKQEQYATCFPSHGSHMALALPLPLAED